MAPQTSPKWPPHRNNRRTDVRPSALGLACCFFPEHRSHQPLHRRCDSSTPKPAFSDIKLAVPPESLLVTLSLHFLALPLCCWLVVFSVTLGIAFLQWRSRPLGDPMTPGKNWREGGLVAWVLCQKETTACRARPVLPCTASLPEMLTAPLYPPLPQLTSVLIN